MNSKDCCLKDAPFAQSTRADNHAKDFIRSITLLQL